MQGYDIYKKNSVVHVPKEKLLIMLVNELKKQTLLAEESFRNNDILAINTSLVKAQEILGELICS